ncbi:hypothetical protein [Corynebacterium argentoratense]|nr:hypothetical protein [Corynebacterium argentoratense]
MKTLPLDKQLTNATRIVKNSRQGRAGGSEDGKNRYIKLEYSSTV